MNSVNNLSPLQKQFGIYEIQTLNIVLQTAKSINKKAEIEYRDTDKLFVIKNLGETTLESFSKTLHNKNLAPNYHAFSPKITKKDGNNNFLIELYPVLKKNRSTTILENDNPNFQGNPDYPDFPIYSYVRKGSIFLPPKPDFNEKKS